MKRFTKSLLIVAALIALAWFGSAVLGDFGHLLFGVLLPYLALATFVIGFIVRMYDWGKSPVPFCITTTCGQQKSMDWVKQSKLENPSSTAGVVGRMVLEVLLFRSLFRNVRTEFRPNTARVSYADSKWLWLFAIAFHYSFLVVVIRHIRFFTAQVPAPVQIMEHVDSFFQLGAPLMYITGVTLLGAATLLLLRRLFIPQVRYFSINADYFPLLVIIGIAGTGVIMRYFWKVDVVNVKLLTMGLATLSPPAQVEIGSLFYVHFFLISVLFAYFPFSKLMHLGGIFLSPTRNMRGDSRSFRHENPWNYPVKVHTYEEYEDEFRDKMKSVDLPVEKEE